MTPTKLILIIEGVAIPILLAICLFCVYMIIHGSIPAVIIAPIAACVACQLAEDFTRLWKYKQHTKKPIKKNYESK